ncbi:unnamed protein product [Phytophthora fragariaefolia]|uniref:Sugar transporter SWEET1 n=1 Tax=Phytophthora fragariaefolia TaxID=1490495 RepID=A0A9W6XN72_9STRA|nr:unnamed protein product [Phytophthora fragariaefolia]
MPAMPLAVMIINNIVWTVYGYLIDSIFPLMATQLFGIVASIVFTAFYYRWAADRRPIHRLLAIGLACCTALTVYVVLGVTGFTNQNDEQVGKSLGYAGLVFNIWMYASPLGTIRHVIRTKSVASLPINISIMMFFNTVLWVSLSIVDDDMIILCINVIGIMLSVTQIAVYMHFRKNSSTIAQDEFADKQLSIIVSPKDEVPKSPVSGAPSKTPPPQAPSGGGGDVSPYRRVSPYLLRVQTPPTSAARPSQASPAPPVPSAPQQHRLQLIDGPIVKSTIGQRDTSGETFEDFTLNDATFQDIIHKLWVKFSPRVKGQAVKQDGAWTVGTPTDAAWTKVVQFKGNRLILDSSTTEQAWSRWVISTRGETVRRMIFEYGMAITKALERGVSESVHTPCVHRSLWCSGGELTVRCRRSTSRHLGSNFSGGYGRMANAGQPHHA